MGRFGEYKKMNKFTDDKNKTKSGILKLKTVRVTPEELFFDSCPYTSVNKNKAAVIKNYVYSNEKRIIA